MITLGLSQIEVGEAAENGIMPTTMAKIGKTYQNTCRLAQEASEVTEHFEEGKASPEVRAKRKKVPVLNFSIMDPDPQVLADYIGGTFTAAAVGPPATPATWGFDGSELVDNKAIRVKTKQGLWVDIPNADIEAVINSEFSDQGIFLVDFTVTPLAVTAGKAITAYEGPAS